MNEKIKESALTQYSALHPRYRHGGTMWLMTETTGEALLHAMADDGLIEREIISALLHADMRLFGIPVMLVVKEPPGGIQLVVCARELPAYL